MCFAQGLSICSRPPLFSSKPISRPHIIAIFYIVELVCITKTVCIIIIFFWSKPTNTATSRTATSRTATTVLVPTWQGQDQALWQGGTGDLRRSGPGEPGRTDADHPQRPGPGPVAGRLPHHPRQVPQPWGLHRLCLAGGSGVQQAHCASASSYCCGHHSSCSRMVDRRTPPPTFVKIIIRTNKSSFFSPLFSPFFFAKMIGIENW